MAEDIPAAQQTADGSFITQLQAANDVNAMTVKIAPDRYRAVAALPQVPTEPISTWIPELERCVNELGMIGLMINPDPFEALDFYPSGRHPDPAYGPLLLENEWLLEAGDDA